MGLIDNLNERMLPVISDLFYQLCAALNPSTFTATDAATPLSAVLTNAARVYYDAPNPAGGPGCWPPISSNYSQGRWLAAQKKNRPVEAAWYQPPRTHDGRSYRSWAV